MTSEEIRKKYLEFFQKKSHTIIDSSSLVPQNDPTTLFTGSGMQPMLEYLLGARHPEGSRIVDSQKCFRSGDIEDIGDNRHTTFFEMLGNWSLGDYFKKEQIEWMFEFLVKEIKLDPKKIFVTAFIGDSKNNVPKDTEAGEIWKKLFKEVGIEAKEVDIGSEEDGYKVGMQDGRIFYYDSKKNWWSRAGVPENMPEGEPGGPDSEMFYEFSDIKHNEKFGKFCHPNCDCGRYLEIGNNVFMQYKKTSGRFDNLPQQNIDFGGGLERLVMASINKSDVFQTDFFEKCLENLETISSKKYTDQEYTKYFRIILDHLRASVFLIGDGVLPGNTDRNYFVRRLLRRAILYFDKLVSQNVKISSLVDSLLFVYEKIYSDTYSKKEDIKKIIDEEENKFRKTLKDGLKKFQKGEKPFILFTTYGFPFELTKELAKEKNTEINEEEFKIEMQKHQELSRTGSEQKFKGGLGDSSEMSVKYHTATHLLHKALRDVLGQSVSQKGSNITPERLRFDFSFDRKMTDEEKDKVEKIVNEKIKENLPVQNMIMKKVDAEKSGALHFFGDKYGDEVSVYFIGQDLDSAYSKEFCGGPHIKNTGELGTFKISKEEAVSAGIRRIKAVLN
jgi:alanyl-tRNA synthetase